MTVYWPQLRLKRSFTEGGLLYFFWTILVIFLLIATSFFSFSVGNSYDEYKRRGSCLESIYEPIQTSPYYFCDYRKLTNSKGHKKWGCVVSKFPTTKLCEK